MDSAGLVLQVRNTSDRSLACLMIATNKTLNESRRHVFSLAPYDKTEIGILEADWTFRSGESVRIEVEGHRPINFKVP